MSLTSQACGTLKGLNQAQDKLRRCRRDSGLALPPPSAAMNQACSILPSWQALGREDSSSTPFFHWARFALFSPQIPTFKPKLSPDLTTLEKHSHYHQFQEIGQEKEIQEGGGRTPLIQNGRQGQVLVLLTGKSWGILSSPLSLRAGERRQWNDQKVAYEWLITSESKRSLFILLSATLRSPLPPLSSKVRFLGWPVTNWHKCKGLKLRKFTPHGSAG